jgi:DNA-binding MarR family transcriptional regulator
VRTPNPRMHLRRARRVWAAITRDPSASIRELSRTTDLHVLEVQRAIDTLEAAGYITRVPHKSRARVVVVPFYRIWS